MSQAYTPRPYQHLITGHLLDVPRAAGWAGMGMGKTISTLTALDALHLSGDTEPALVLAPLRVARSTWPDEAKKWDHLRATEVSPVIGDERARRKALKRSATVYTINYENIPWLIETLDGAWPFSKVVADESTKLKGFRLRQGSRRAQALAKVAHAKVRHWFNLTGTPSPNGLVDLWGQSWFLDAGARLGRTFTGFTQRWFRPTYDGYGIEPLPFAQEQIEDKLRDVCLSVNAKDYFDVRVPIVNNIFVELPPKARQLYRQMEREMFAEIEGHPVEAFNAAAKTMKCLQLANGAAYIDEAAAQWREIHDAKIQAVDDVVEEAAGAPVMVAYHFRSDLARLQRAFPRGRVLDTKQDEDDWNAGRIPILFIHPKSAGHGLNLQDGGNILVYFAHDWNLEDRMQVLERIGPVRQMQSGHDRPVFVHNIIARDTVDELVLARVESKRSVQDLLLEAVTARGKT